MQINPMLEEAAIVLAAIKAEIEGMVIGLEGRKAKGRVRDRALYLQARFATVKSTLRSFETELMAHEVAYQERTGQLFDEELHQFTAADETRAAEILTIFGLRQNTQGNVGVNY